MSKHVNIRINPKPYANNTYITETNTNTITLKRTYTRASTLTKQIPKLMQ